MDGPRDAAPLRHAVLALAAAAMALLVPLLLPTMASALDGTGALTGAVLAVAVAALFVAARDTAGWHDLGTSAGVVTRRPAPIVLATRTTDPTHHPLRPRAPGTD